MFKRKVALIVILIVVFIISACGNINNNNINNNGNNNYDYNGDVGDDSGDDDIIDHTYLEIFYDFSSDLNGFIGDFSDLPSGFDNDLYRTKYELRDLPVSVDKEGKGAYFTFNNGSDDIFAFMKKKLTTDDGILPDKRYFLTIELTLASSAPKGGMGIGGAPGEAVIVKVGGSSIEPKPLIDDLNDLRMNIDKGIQMNNGSNGIMIGDVTKPTSEDFESFELKTLSNKDSKLVVESDENGNLWIFVGTDSGFEGITELYYTEIKVILEMTDETIEFNQKYIDNNMPEIKTDSGRFQDMNNNTMNIKISGIPDELPSKQFVLSEGVINSLADLELSKNDEILFEYISDGENDTITQISILSRYKDENLLEFQGTYVGLADGRIFEMTDENGNPLMFYMDNASDFMDKNMIGMNSILKIQYEKTEHHNLVSSIEIINRVEERSGDLSFEGMFVYAEGNNVLMLDGEGLPMWFYKDDAQTFFVENKVNFGDSIYYSYYISDDVNYIVKVEIFDRIENPYELLNLQGEYVGLIDNNSFETIIDGEALAFRIHDVQSRINEKDIESGDTILISAYIDDIGRYIAFKIDK